MDTVFFKQDKGMSGKLASEMIDDDALTLPPQKTYRNKRRKELRRLLYNIIHAYNLTKARGHLVRLAVPLRKIHENEERFEKVSYSGLKAVMSDMEDSGYITVDKGKFGSKASKDWKKHCVETNNYRNRATEVKPTGRLEKVIDDYLEDNTHIGKDVEMLVTSDGVTLRDTEGKVNGKLNTPKANEFAQTVANVEAGQSGRGVFSPLLPLPLPSLISSIRIPTPSDGGRKGASPSSPPLLPPTSITRRFHDAVVSRLPAAWEWKHEIKDGHIIYEIPERALDYTRKFVRGSWDCGGRFYANIQNIPSDWRKYIRIGGEGVTELDYDGLHFNILYAKEGETLDGDPYETECDLFGDLTRSINKLVAQVMLNARSSQQLYSTLKEGIDWKEEFGLFIPDEVWTEVVNALRKRHEPIKQYFHSDIGIRLQREDSDLAYRVMKNTGAICIHDGFIIEEGREERLRAEMKQAFADEYGIDIGISKE